MADLLDRAFGRRSRALALARSAELRSELVRAARLYERAGRPDEAARVRKARALAVLASTMAVPVTASRRAEVAEAAADLESLGELARAAEAYGRAQDVEGQARVLARSGDVERLDDLLGAELARGHEARAERGAHEEFDLLVASGRRREAIELARAFAGGALRKRGVALFTARVAGAPVRAALRGRELAVVLGERVVIGRVLDVEGALAIGTVAVASAAVSRRHLSIARRDGEFWVRDLGSHNGTTLGGTGLDGEARVGSGLELRLGNEVSLVLQPTTDLPGALAIEVAGHRYVAPLGPARLGVGSWRLERVRSVGAGAGAGVGERAGMGAGAGAGVHPSADAGGDEWVELVTDDAPPAFAGGLRLSSRVTLLAGDGFATEAGGDLVLRFAP